MNVPASVQWAIAHSLYARGYLIGRSESRLQMRSTVPAEWQELGFGTGGNTFALFYDYRNTVAAKESNGRFAMILGKCMDVELMTMHLESIVEQILPRIGREDDLLDYIDTLCGRFIIVYGDANSAYLVQDACGMRTCFYSKDFASSHYGLVGKVGRHGNLEYMRTYNSLKNRPWSLPGGLTPFEGVLTLMPNHRLDLVKGGVSRIYPRKPLSPMSGEAAADYFAKVMQTQMRILTERYKLCVSITAGKASRVTFAALKGMQERVTTFTYSRTDRDVYAEDVRIARDLSERFGFKWNHIRVSPADQVQEILRSHYQNHYHTHFASALVHYMTEFPGEEYLHLRSNILETVRLRHAYIFENGDWHDIHYHSYRLAERDGFAETASRDFYGREEYDKIAKLGYRQDDLLYWEHRMGDWNAGGVILETDMAFDTWCLFNQRKCLDLMLRAPLMYRRNNYFVFRPVELMWPEALWNIPGQDAVLLSEYSWASAFSHEALTSISVDAAYSRKGSSYAELGFDRGGVKEGEQVSATLRLQHPLGGLRCSFCLSVHGSFIAAKQYSVEVKCSNGLKKIFPAECFLERSLPVEVYVPSSEQYSKVLVGLIKNGSSCEPQFSDGDVLLRISEIMTSQMSVSDWAIRANAADPALGLGEPSGNCIRLLPTSSKCHWTRAADNLTPGCSYKLTVDEVVVESGKTRDVEVILYDAVAQRYRLRKRFPVPNGRCENLEWCFSVPEPPGTYQLLVYAGIAGETENIGVFYKNIKVATGLA